MYLSLMIVDDSSIVRALTSKALAQNDSIKIAAAAADGEEAVRLAKKHHPDVIILDIEMPRMDGLTALPLLLDVAPNTKIIMASRLTKRGAEVTVKALELGAADYISKPEIDSLDKYYEDLTSKVLALGKPYVADCKKIEDCTNQPVIAKDIKPIIIPTIEKPIHALAIAASTGGPQALLKVIEGLKGHLKHIPIFITQHMPATFTTVFAEHLGKAGGFPTSEATNNQVAKAGHIYVAPGDYHLIAKKMGNEVILQINQDPHVNFCRPAADPMFKSLSDVYGENLLAVVLTGMGYDGADGAQKIAERGGAVIAQDAESCVVYGMPRAVAERGLCQAILPLDFIATEIIRRCK